MLYLVVIKSIISEPTKLPGRKKKKTKKCPFRFVFAVQTYVVYIVQF